MHVLGILFLCLIAGHLFAFVDSLGAWVFDRKNARRGCETDQPEEGEQ